MSIKIEDSGRVVGSNTHDSSVVSVDRIARDELDLIVRRADNSRAAIQVQGITKSIGCIAQGDVLLEIFFWTDAQMDELPGGTWLDLIGEYSEMNRAEAMQKLRSAIPDRGGIVRFYCATNGALTLACLSLDVVDFTPELMETRP